MTMQTAVTDAIQLLATVRSLASRNRRRQVTRQHIAILAVIACVAIVALVWLTDACSISMTDGVTHALRFPIVMVVIVGWITMGFAARQRRQSRRGAERSWLAALPLGEPAFAAEAGRHLSTILASVLLFLMTSLLALGWMLELPSRSVLTLSLLLIVGATFGAMIGWTLARKDPRPPRIRLPGISTAKTEQRFPLGRWPLRHSRAHADLALHARAIGLLLLSLPIGVPPGAVVAMIVFGLAALTIWDLSRALLATTRLAGAWLRCLPVDSRKATLALGCRSVLTIVVAAAIVLGATALPMGMSVATAGLAVFTIGMAVVFAFALLATVHQPFGARR